MKIKFVTLIAATITLGLSAAAFADSNAMGNMQMDGMKMDSTSAASNAADLSDATVEKVDSASGMITLKHAALANIHMPAMTMAYKAKDAQMVKQAIVGEKVKVKVENVGNTLEITTLEKAQ